MIHSASWGRKSDYSILAKGFDNFIYENEDFIAITAGMFSFSLKFTIIWSIHKFLL